MPYLMNPKTEVVSHLDQRVSRLEGALGWRVFETKLRTEYFWISLPLGAIGVIAAFFGLGFPNHLYQLVFALLSVSFLYHRGVLAAPRAWWQLTLFLVNVATLSMLFKLLIGSGKAQPFSWIQIPKFQSVPKGEGQWFPLMPGMKVSWEESFVSGLIVDLTMFQTFLLILIVLGMLLSFQLLSSVLALFLLILSIPALLTFSWPWILPAMILFGVSIYLQLSVINREPVLRCSQDPSE